MFLWYAALVSTRHFFQKQKSYQHQTFEHYNLFVKIEADYFYIANACNMIIL